MTSRITTTSKTPAPSKGAKVKAKPASPLHPQKQLYVVVGNLDEPIDGYSSWAFQEYANTGKEAAEQAVETALSYGFVFTMELCQYVRAPRIKGGRPSYNRTSTNVS